MPQTIDREVANQAHPTTRILPTEEERAEQTRYRMKVAAIAAAASVGALAIAGGVWYAYRAGWIGSPPPRRFARRTFEAARAAAVDSFGAARCAATGAYESVLNKIKAA